MISKKPINLIWISQEIVWFANLELKKENYYHEGNLWFEKRDALLKSLSKDSWLKLFWLFEVKVTDPFIYVSDNFDDLTSVYKYLIAS